MAIATHKIRQLTISTSQDTSEVESRTVTMSIGGGPAGAPRIVGEVVVVPFTTTMSFTDSDTGESLLNMNLLADVSIEFDDEEREEKISSIKETQELTPSLEEQVRNRLIMLSFTTLVRLSQDLLIPPPLTLPQTIGETTR